MCSSVLDEIIADDEIYRLAWVDDVLIDLVIFEFDPDPINSPPVILKVPLKSIAIFCFE